MENVVAKDNTLEGILNDGSRVEAVLLSTWDGMPLKWSTANTLNEELIAVAGTHLARLGKEVAAKLDFQSYTHMVVKVRVGFVIVKVLSRTLILTVLATKGCNVGFNLNLINEVTSKREEAEWLRM